MCLCPGVGNCICTVVPARYGSRHHAGMIACAEIPPVLPACTEAMMHDPRCCGVAAQTGPGVLWW
eukprot:6222165-Prymnesium_polylepis.1